MAALHAETLKKLKQGLSRIIPWSKLLENLPENLKISPLAAVPQSSQAYCTILDLSFILLLGGLHLPSVNAATILQADAHAMKELGNDVPRLIATMVAAALQYGPIFFAKWDIKDGFWCMTWPMHRTSAMSCPHHQENCRRSLHQPAYPWDGANPCPSSLLPQKQPKMQPKAS